MLVAGLYVGLRFLVDLFLIRQPLAHRDAELLLLRHELSVLRRSVKKPRPRMWDRMILSALAMRLPRSTWGALIVRPGDAVGLASNADPAQVGSLQPPTAAGSTSNARRVPATDPALGQRESSLGLRAHPRRATQAWLRDLTHRDQQPAPPSSASNLASPLEAELATVPEGASVGDRGRRLLHCRDLEPQSDSTSFSFMELGRRRILGLG